MNSNTLNAFNLSGHVELVTGASKGMGRSIAAILAQAALLVVGEGPASVFMPSRRLHSTNWSASAWMAGPAHGTK